MPEPDLQDKTKRIFRIDWIYIFISLAILFFILPNLFFNPKEITIQEFDRKILARHAVEKIEVINNETAEIYIKKDLINDPFFKDVLKPVIGQSANTGPHYQITIGSSESFERNLEEVQKDFPENQKVNVSYVKRKNWLGEILSWTLPIILMILLFRYIGRMGAGVGGKDGTSIFNFGRSTATLFDKENKSSVTFDDVAGLEEAKIEMKEIVDFLKDPNAFTKLGAKIPKGVIIVGPPGTGKTLLVKAVANEAQVPFFSISGSEFVEMFVGVGASRVRDLFRRAKEKAPCIVFIDEIDAVGRSRGKNTFYQGANDERESTLNQLLTEMDGFGTNSGVMVLAATNRADMLDLALLRPGRFDRHIYLELPNLIERKAIFKVHIKPLFTDETVDIDFLSAQTPGCSGADIANICNEAALIAARRKAEKVGKQDFMDAIDRIIAGVERKSKIISPNEKKIIAYHEAGHAVVSWMLKNVDPLIKVSIVPRGKSLGSAWYLPEEHQLRNTAQFDDMLCAALGGRVAEEIIFGDVTSGALDDLEKATKQAYTMVAVYGFNKNIGNVSFYDSSGMNETGLQKRYSEETGKIIDEEVRALIESAYQRTKNILTKNKSALTALADRLLKQEVVLKEDLEEILGKRPVTSEENAESTASKIAMNQAEIL
jgi:AFG3 family protein